VDGPSRAPALAAAPHCVNASASRLATPRDGPRHVSVQFRPLYGPKASLAMAKIVDRVLRSGPFYGKT